MSAAIVPAQGEIRQLDRPAEPEEQVVPEDIADASKVARLLMRILRELATLTRRWAPFRVDVEDREVDGTGTTKYRFPHGVGGRVRWWPVGWSGASLCPNLVEHSDTDDNTLVLVSYEAGTLTLRIEAAG